MFSSSSIIGIVGSGALGSGIAQVAATAGHVVCVYDSNLEVLGKAKTQLQQTLQKLVEKQKITAEKAEQITNNTIYCTQLDELSTCDLVIEAIVERLDIKQKVFNELEKTCKSTTVLASNTSSLSITSIASACSNPQKVIGIHFFNPAPLMPLVEIIGGNCK